MSLTRFLTAAAVAALIATPAFAQDQAASAASPPVAAKPVVVNGDLVDTLKLSGQFTTFVKGIDATNLAGLLKSNQYHLTVFAPTDAAFAEMPADKLAALQSDKTAMQHFILHHIVNAPIPSSKIKGAKGPVPSAAGDTIMLDGSDEGGALKVDGATIVQPDLQTSTALLQVVDHVLVHGEGAPAEPAAADASTTAPANPGA